MESDPGQFNVPKGMLASSAPAAALAYRESIWLDLVGGMAAGSQEALSRLYDETSGVAYGLALRILRNKEDAEEAVLDAYSRAWRLAKGFDSSRGSVMTWLVMMTRSIAIDRLRSRATRDDRTETLDEPYHQAPAEGPDPELNALFRQQRERVLEALGRLPAEQCQAVEMAFFGGYSHSELSERLGVPLGTVKTRVRLGLTRLRAYLEDLE
ncbi:MAG: sigma-70 family RNA polymerase sigma factor [Acidobacteria bacterium]|nr:sigma-70 family RNA polymerase sigma factor [Acidobacteriota bacterium]